MLFSSSSMMICLSQKYLFEDTNFKYYVTALLLDQSISFILANNTYKPPLVAVIVHIIFKSIK